MIVISSALIPGFFSAMLSRKEEISSKEAIFSDLLMSPIPKKKFLELERTTYDTK
ncbi:MAG: hypothetical protein HFJ19_02595 [Clostridia bacterium]|nr:hypothetical protein [Clostridia bacterium]